jgi:hypothetical protein
MKTEFDHFVHSDSFAADHQTMLTLAKTCTGT